MFYADVETDIGERLSVRRSDGHFGGNATLSMILGINQYCSDTDTTNNSVDMQNWFLALENRAGVSICELSKTLMHSFYSGEWEYKEDEYLLYQKRTRDMQLTEERFVATVRHVRNLWVDANTLTTNLNQLISLLIESNSEPTWWYEPRQSETDLIALSQTLATVLARGAKQVRIKFT